MKSLNSLTRSVLFVPVVALLLLTVLGAMSVDSYAKGSKAKGPKCKYQELGGTKIIAYNCDRFQSKGDIDEVTPQLKIISPEPGDVIDYSTLTDSNGNGFVELPITVIMSPDSDYTIDFTAATSAATQYGFQPQVAGLGHAHAYVVPEIDVMSDGEGGYVVDFVGSDNRSDFVGGFCVFRNPIAQTEDYQIVEANCELFQTVEPIVSGRNYRVIVDTTQNSHDSRIKHHPRDVPPGDQVIIQFTNAPE